MISLIKGLGPSRSSAARAGTGQVGRAVFWSFVGIRRGRDLDRDAGAIAPLQVIVAGLIGAAGFVALLLLVVRVVMRLA